MYWPYHQWVDAVMLLRVQDQALGWSWNLFREWQPDPTNWSQEKIAAELERLYGSGSRRLRQPQPA